LEIDQPTNLSKTTQKLPRGDPNDEENEASRMPWITMRYNWALTSQNFEGN
jgi:hypothetical protein